MNKKDYVVVTAVSMFRTRYVLHKDDLEQVAEEHLDWCEDLIECARDIVSSEECEEFSQEYMGKYIVDQMELNEDDMLELFDKDNDYLSEFTTDEKTKWIRQLFKDVLPRSLI